VLDFCSESVAHHILSQVLGAHIAQIRTVILPWSNRKDVEYDVPLEVQQSMKFVYVRTVEEVIDAAFGEGKVFLKLQPALMFDSHL
jgi:ATP-dependent Lon protease